MCDDGALVVLEGFSRDGIAHRCYAGPDYELGFKVLAAVWTSNAIGGPLNRSKAVQALGAAPSLLRADHFDDARGYLHAAIKSRIAPVLVLDRGPAEDAHAVAIVGMVQSDAADLAIKGVPGGTIADAAGTMKSLLVHDDRVGPYRIADIDSLGSKMQLHLTLRGHPDPWPVKQILIPTHQKIRLSFASLRDISVEITKNAFMAIHSSGDDPVIFENYVQRGHEYVEDLALDPAFDLDKVSKLLTGEILLSRYVGVIRLSAAVLDTLDILVDTTSTSQNLHFIAVVVRSREKEATQNVAQILSDQLKDRHSEMPVVG